MTSLLGSFTYSVDSKGRISIPAKMKKSLSPEAKDTFILTRGFEQCIYAYPLDEWSIYERKLRSLSPTDPRDRFFIRMLVQSYAETQLDTQSRIVVPKHLLKHAQIVGEVLILGALEHLELWNPEVYHNYVSAQKESYEDVAKVFLSKG